MTISLPPIILPLFQIKHSQTDSSLSGGKLGRGEEGVVKDKYCKCLFHSSSLSPCPPSQPTPGRMADISKLHSLITNSHMGNSFVCEVPFLCTGEILNIFSLFFYMTSSQIDR